MMYEDLTAGNRVMRVFDSLVHHCGRDLAFSSDMWKFDTLRCPAIAKLAAQDARQADIVIISAHGSEELPEELKSWLHQWIGRGPAHPAALVALLDHAAGLLAQFDPALSYLAQTARHAGLEFVPMFIEQEEMELSVRHAFSEADEPPAVLEAFCRRVAHAPPPASPSCATTV
jgi:hypothetical protein